MGQVTLKIQFNTDNEAFTDNPVGEATRIIRKETDRVTDQLGLLTLEGIEKTDSTSQIRDYNGNKVGNTTLEIEL